MTAPHRLLPLLFLVAPPALADDPFTLRPPPSLSLAAQPQHEPDVPTRPLPQRERFGNDGSMWLTFGLGHANDFGRISDYNVYASWSQFLIDDVEFLLEANIWYFDQTGSDAFGFNPTMGFRWHFINTGQWTTYAELGMGLLLATSPVPASGTQFDFMPRVGGGVTYLLSEADQTRLQVGLRWHHISNARITGDARNPGRDAPMLYAGVIFPF